MSFRVLKFGGTSVGSPARLERVLGIIAHEHAAGPVAVVVSAMNDTTDWLIEAFDEAGEGHTAAAEASIKRVRELAVETAIATVMHLPGEAKVTFDALADDILAPLREALRTESLVRGRAPALRDYVLSFGERLSAAIVVALLQARGVAALVVDARTWTVTDDQFGAARVNGDLTFPKVRALVQGWGHHVSVHTGFIGATVDGRTTTLGRNGSDYTAAILAAALGAKELTAWTDVSGVLTADPALVAESYPVRHLSQREALELANLGFAMFHPRTMVPLFHANVPLRIRNTMHPEDPGTLVDAAGSPDASRPTCIVTLEDLALVEVEYAPRSNHPIGIGQRVLKVLENAGIPVRISTQSPLGRAASVVVQQRDLARTQHAIGLELAADIDREEIDPLRIRTPVTLVMMMTETIGQGSNVAGRFFGALGAVGINVRAAAQGASSRSLACVVDAAETSLAARSIHAAFNMAHSEVSLLVLGKGIVGGQLLAQIQAQAEQLRREDGVLLKVVGIVGRDRALFDERGLDLEKWKTQYADAPIQPPTSPETLGPLLDRLVRLPVPILVDCTAADGMESLYVEAFARGVHVVGANKKPLALPPKERDALMACARRHHRLYLYETTVGASLPVIATLKDLVRTGDRVRLIEGSFSGTLGFLVNELMRGVPLSVAVADARERGYTEPHPRDDLSGLDVARKGLILARELGINLTLEDVHVEPFVPRELLGEADVGAFFKALATLDASMAARIDRLKAEGKVLRYLARIDPSASNGPIVQVGPIPIAQEHAATRLRGSEAFVAFTTERYSDYPLVVQGSGAGGAVTAAGVLADVLKVTQTLRGR